MDKKEVFEIIRSLRTKHGISLGDIEDIQQSEIEKLSSIEKIFDMSNQYDVDLLVALIYLLNDEPEPVYEWFKNSHEDCKYLRKSKTSFNVLGDGISVAAGVSAGIGISAFTGVEIDGAKIHSFSEKKEPKKHDLFKLLIAAFIQNPLFFSMAWNWNIFNLNSIADNKSISNLNQEDELDDFYIPMAASSADKGFLYKEIPDIGTMYMYYDEDYEELTLRIEVNEENLNKIFKVRQKIQYAETGYISEIRIEANGQKTIQKATKPKGNPLHGIRYFGKPKIIFE